MKILTPSKLDLKLCTSNDIVYTIPEYALKSNHTKIESYIIHKEYQTGCKEPRKLLSPTDDLVQLKTNKKHSYGITFPINNCDFLGIDLDKPSNIDPVCLLLNKYSIIEQYHIYMSSYRVFEEHVIDDIKNSDNIRALLSPNLHVYCKLDGSYDTTQFYGRSKTYSIHEWICNGYLRNALRCGNFTLRIAEKFNPDKTDDEYALSNFLRLYGINKSCRITIGTKPLLIYSVDKREKTITSHVDSVLDNLTIQKINNLGKKYETTSNDNINKNILTRLR